MPLFDDEDNKCIRYYMKMWGHLDDCFIRINSLMPQFSPKQISNHWKNHLDPQLYSPKSKSINFWNTRRKSLGKDRNNEKKQESRTGQNECFDYKYFTHTFSVRNSHDYFYRTILYSQNTNYSHYTNRYLAIPN
ncbi:hypothetical protein GLOIN_2v1886514 [Rhizophagus clarus]|uniref:HTH myb-type domain-containing protein n=1 Tax=Rhizophagus clarus TaxID=94130 RepID=A0A8H3MIW8_9GLOM|nr:hypothetical protein GLOIN_2v1886514 [Rhizophagus clarus]